MVQLTPRQAPAARLPAAVLLDAMGTLVELEPPAPHLRAALREQLGVEVTLPEAAAAIEAEIAYYRAHHDAGRDRAGLARLRRACAQVVRDALPQLARVPVGAVVPALMASLRFNVYEDVVPALRAMRGHGIRRVVVSNWDVSLHDVLAGAGLDRLVDGIVTSAELGASKPDPALFRHALVMAGVPAARALHVGDRLDEDVAGARAAGIEAVLLRRDGGAGPDGVRTISTLAELLPAPS